MQTHDILTKQYKKFLYEDNIEGMDSILQYCLEDEELTRSILALNRRYEEQNNLAPSSEQEQRSLNRLQKLFSSEQTTHSPLIIDDFTLEDNNSGKDRKEDDRPKKANAFQKATLVAEIIDQYHKEDTFGAVKCQKVVYLCEMHARLDSLQTIYYRKVAGPYDNQLSYRTLPLIEKQKWFKVMNVDERTCYVPGDSYGSHRNGFSNFWGYKQEKIQEVVDLLRPHNTSQAELVATLYSVWNDLIIDGSNLDDHKILDKFYQWNDSKKKYKDEQCLKCLGWMRKKGLVPVGFGNKTKIVKKKKK